VWRRYAADVTDLDAQPVVAFWIEYVSWLGAHVPLAVENLAPGATDELLDEVAVVVGHDLPADIRALLRLNNGQRRPLLATSDTGGEPAFPGTNLLSTDSIIKEWRGWRDLDADRWQDIGSTLAPEMVKPLYSCPHWVPVLSAVYRADYFGADFDPEPAGTSGQIINFGRDEERHYLAAPSTTELIRLIVNQVMAGTGAVDEDDALQDGAWEGYRHAFEIVYYHRFPAGHPDHDALDYDDWNS